MLRRLARDHWVRIHGTPRITVLAGGDHARRIWNEWIELSALDATLLDAAADFDTQIRHAASSAVRNPSRAIAVHAPLDVITKWQHSAPDRLRALVAEGFLAIDDDPQRVAASSHRRLDARSAAEAVLYEALEATAATAGRFELNGRLSIYFGPDAAEVDLLSREDRIAVEIDGYHHFHDADAYRRDRRKDLLLQSQGLIVIRVLADDVMRDPIAAVNLVCQAIACRMEVAR